MSAWYGNGADGPVVHCFGSATLALLAPSLARRKCTSPSLHARICLGAGYMPLCWSTHLRSMRVGADPGLTRIASTQPQGQARGHFPQEQIPRYTHLVLTCISAVP